MLTEYGLRDFDINFLDLHNREKIERISSNQSNQVVAIVGEDLVTVSNVASLLAKNWLPFSYDKTPSDLHYASCGESGWVVENIETEIVEKLRIQPHIKHVIIIESSELFTKLGWDKLLKILEDPITDACFILCFSDLSNLPTTIKGRITDFIDVDFLNPQLHVDYLIACGFTPLNSKAGWDGGKGIPSLALELCKSYDNAKIVLEFWDLSKTLKVDTRLWDGIVASSLIWEGKGEAGELDKASSKLGKILFRKWLRYYEEHIVSDLEKTVVGNSHGKDIIMVESLLGLIHTVNKMLNLNVSLQYVVFYFIYKNIYITQNSGFTNFMGKK